MAELFEHSKTLIDLTEIFDQLELSYFIVGSVASGFRGEFRATNDIDIVCDFSSASNNTASKFTELARAKFYCDPLSLVEAIREKRSCNIIHEKTFVKVDLFTKVSELEKAEFSRCTKLQIPGSTLKVNVASVEYNVIAKLNWYIKSNKVLERQLLDIRSMLVINRESLDLDYLNKWAKSFDTQDLLNELIGA